MKLTTDQEWELLAPFIPRAATGSPRVEDRQVVNGMVYKIRTGISWRDLPERYGSDLKLGRFTQPDPSGKEGNAYLYAVRVCSR
ncbi:transposase [Streptomyces sp. NBC_00377]|uniref:transposase n=1 Tax=unclassified Streptomyces TaxID=2593676 RepID=UPI002E250026|nr:MULTISPECIES: transposase [unclassified Streptomyces]